jgi:hypothetical protein
LWILFAWVHENATHSPKLLITSPEADSGKSTLGALISFLTPWALSCIEITEATLFRSIERWSPTLIIDEADTILINNEPLLAVINGSWTRGTVVPRCIGDDHIPHAFPIFCPQVIIMKGKRLAHTTLTRCISTELERKRKGDRVEHFNHLDDAELAMLRQQALGWALDHGGQLKNAQPEMPEQFYNRHGDNYRMLFAIADLAGGDWPEQARAAQRLSGAVDTTSRNVRLLAAIKTVFDERGIDAISSADLVGALTADETAEWNEWKNGKPITQAQLASVLGGRGGFGIPVTRPYIESKRLRGYERNNFEDPWNRYLPPENEV